MKRVLLGVCSDGREDVHSEIVPRVCTCTPFSPPTITVCMGALHVNSRDKIPGFYKYYHLQ